MCIFAVSKVCTKEVSLAPVYAGVFILQLFFTIAYISVTQSLQGVHMRSCVRSLFIRVGAGGLGPSTNPCRALVDWRGGLILTEKR